MKKIICRFRNEEDLNTFSNGMLDKDVKEVVFEDYAIKEIKRKPTKTKKAEHHKIDEYMSYWKEMPEWNMDFDTGEYTKIEFSFDEESTDLKWLSEVFQQNITDKTKSVWVPKLEPGEHRNIRVLGGKLPRYPIYVVSKGRYGEYRFSTSNWLSRMGVPHYIVVEPQEVELYKNSKIGQSPYCTIVELDMSYKEKYNLLEDYAEEIVSTGPGPARNFVADRCRAQGWKWVHIYDDNIEDFDMYWRGRRILAHTPDVISSLEDFVERFDGVLLAGLNYSKFMVGLNVYPPFTFNTRIYSFGMWNLDEKYKSLVDQFGALNEDTLQSLAILDAGYNTIQWNLYTGAKVTTQKIKAGGNSAEIYQKQGTYNKSLMLANYYPQYAKLVWKFSRWHHEVDYSSFTQRPTLKPEYKDLKDITDDRGTWIVRIPKELCLTEFDNREYLEEHYPKGCPEDITNSDTYLVKTSKIFE